MRWRRRLRARRAAITTCCTCRRIFPQVIDLLRREDAHLREVEALIHRADILVTGIGEAHGGTATTGRRGAGVDPRQQSGRRSARLLCACGRQHRPLSAECRSDTGGVGRCAGNRGRRRFTQGRGGQAAQAGVREAELVTDEGGVAGQKELRKTEETDYGNKNQQLTVSDGSGAMYSASRRTIILMWKW